MDMEFGAHLIHHFTDDEAQAYIDEKVQSGKYWVLLWYGMSKKGSRRIIEEITEFFGEKEEGYLAMLGHTSCLFLPKSCVKIEDLAISLGAKKEDIPLDPAIIVIKFERVRVQ